MQTSLLFRLQLLVVLLVSSGLVMQAQCVIDTTNFQVVTPPSEELPCIERNAPYSATLQFFTPPAIAGVTIDSIKVTSFNGLPNGIHTVCTPIICTMAALQRACISIEGTTNDTAGTYLIDYDGFAYTSQGTPSFDYLRNNFGLLPNYELIVINQGDVCANSPISSVGHSSDKASDFSVYPNPSNGIFNVQFNYQNSLFNELTVRDVTGRLAYSETLNATGQLSTVIDLTRHAKGIYQVQVKSSNGIVSKLIAVE